MAALEWVVWVVLSYLLAVMPFFLTLLADIYWKYELMRSTCEQEHACTHSEHVHHMRIIMHSQSYAVFIAFVLHIYWFLFCITVVLIRSDQYCNQRNQRIEKLKRS